MWFPHKEDRPNASRLRPVTTSTPYGLPTPKPWPMPTTVTATLTCSPFLPREARQRASRQIPQRRFPMLSQTMATPSTLAPPLPTPHRALFSPRALWRSCTQSRQKADAMNKCWPLLPSSSASAKTARPSSTKTGKAAKTSGASTTPLPSHATSGSTTPPRANTPSRHNGKARTATRTLPRMERVSTT